jgi:3-methylfumaryl-CoA hydratase
MANANESYDAWIGRTETLDEQLALAPVLSLCATLDDGESQFSDGADLPALWHWLYFLPRALRSAISEDGHPQRGGFLPPVKLPRRMFAGARMQFHAPLRIGAVATRLGEVLDVKSKHGKSGELVFVTVRYRISQDDRMCVEEEQDIVYREPGAPVPPPRSAESWPRVPDNSWTEIIRPDPVLLFRFSALTFNAHRIHYDRPYATAVEGYPGLVVHGPLTAMLLMELVRRQVRQRVVSFSFRGRAPLFDLAPFRVVASATHPGEVELTAQGPDGATAMEASAGLAD